MLIKSTDVEIDNRGYYINALKLFMDKNIENIHVLSSIGVDPYAIFSSTKFVYPDHEMHIDYYFSVDEVGVIHGVFCSIYSIKNDVVIEVNEFSTAMVVDKSTVYGWDYKRFIEMLMSYNCNVYFSKLNWKPVDTDYDDNKFVGTGLMRKYNIEIVDTVLWFDDVYKTTFKLHN